jgi:hypothetical protein
MHSPSQSTHHRPRIGSRSPGPCRSLWLEPHTTIRSANFRHPAPVPPLLTIPLGHSVFTARRFGWTSRLVLKFVYLKAASFSQTGPGRALHVPDAERLEALIHRLRGEGHHRIVRHRHDQERVTRRNEPILSTEVAPRARYRPLTELLIRLRPVPRARPGPIQEILKPNQKKRRELPAPPGLYFQPKHRCPNFLDLWRWITAPFLTNPTPSHKRNAGPFFPVLPLSQGIHRPAGHRRLDCFKNPIGLQTRWRPTLPTIIVDSLVREDLVGIHMEAGRERRKQSRKPKELLKHPTTTQKLRDSAST